MVALMSLHLVVFGYAFQELLRRMCPSRVPGCGKLFAGKVRVVLALADVGAKVRFCVWSSVNSF